MRRYQPQGDSSPNNTKTSSQNHPEPSQKMRITFPSHNTNSYEEEDPTTPVTIYLHSPASKSVKIEIATKISMPDIKKIVEERIGIKQDHQLLYLNGKNVTEYGYVRLQNNNIIHISNSDDLCFRDQQITIKLTMWNFLRENQNKIIQTYNVQSTVIVEEFISQIKSQMYRLLNVTNEEAKIYFLESSRLLENEKSFVEQDVTNNAEVIGVITLNELKTRFSNDTKEQIIHDISQLLGFEEKKEQEEIKLKPVKFVEPKSVRPRFKPKEPKKNYVIEETNEDEDDPYGLIAGRSLASSVSLPNFKKKPAPLLKASSFDEGPRTLVTKIKASKSKKDLQLLLKSQEKQGNIFQSPEIIKQSAKEYKEEQQAKIDPPKEAKKELKRRPSPQIPKSMPVMERRQIRKEIEKLFNFEDLSETPKSEDARAEAKEEFSPISPPTDASKSGEKNPMRLSLGSRPMFFDQIKISSNKKQSDD